MKKIWIWGSSILTPVIVGVLVERLKDYPVASQLWICMQWSYNKLIWLINLNVKLWVITVILGCAFFLRWCVHWYNKNIKVHPLEKNVCPTPLLAYTSDTIMGIRWSWRWVKGAGDKWFVTDLTHLCPIDGTPLTSMLICPRCGKDYYSIYPDTEKVLILIQDNARRRCLDDGQWITPS